MFSFSFKLMKYRHTWLRSSPVCCAFATERPKAKAIKAMIAAFIASKPDTCFHKRRKKGDGRETGRETGRSRQPRTNDWCR